MSEQPESSPVCIEESESPSSPWSHRLISASWCLFCSPGGLLLLMSGYCVLGAALFSHLESVPFEDVPPDAIQKSREDCLKELWGITERLNVLYIRNWTLLVDEQLLRFESSVIAAARSDGGLLQGGQPHGQPGMQAGHWSFSGALLYSLSIVTTIGYGTMSPKTAASKVCTVLYAAIGVPLTLMCLSSLGSLLAKGFRRLWLTLCCGCHNNQEVNQNMGGAWRKPGDVESECFGQYTNTQPSQGYLRVPNCPQMAPNSPHRHQCPRGGNSHEELEPPPLMDSPARRKYQQQQLATVNVNHTRRGLPVSRPRPPEVTQLIAEHHVTSMNHVTSEEEEDNDLEQSSTCTHDTPSRVPLIWRPPEPQVTCHINTAHGQPPCLDNASPGAGVAAVPVSVVLLVLATYVGLGAFVLSLWEDWTLLDAAYFCFVTLSTIGFGDFIPVKSLTDVSNRGQLQLLACCGYLVVGLVLIAMAFSLIQDEVIRKCRFIANKIMKH